MKNKIILIVLGILILTSIGLVIFFFTKPDNKENNPSIKIVDSIDGFDYTLDDRDTELFKQEFKFLKILLETDEINYEKYADGLGKLFIIDFYTLLNKVNKYDVGSLEYIHKDMVDNFSLKAKDTLYKYIEDDSNHKRKQTLPEVESVSVLSVDATEFTIEESKMSGFKVNIEWTYKEALGYDEKGEITFVKLDKKLVLVNYESINKQ